MSLHNIFQKTGIAVRHRQLIYNGRMLDTTSSIAFLLLQTIALIPANLYSMRYMKGQ